MSKILLITNPAHDIATQYFEALAGPRTYANLEIAKRIYDNLNDQVCLGDPQAKF